MRLDLAARLHEGLGAALADEESTSSAVDDQRGCDPDGEPVGFGHGVAFQA
jgi:hypothetical protein